MNSYTAFEILNIKLSDMTHSDLTPEYLKKKYRIAALKHHPDKNGNTLESNATFHKITDAYNYLREQLAAAAAEGDGEGEGESNDTDTYVDLLKKFMKTTIKCDDVWSDIVNKIILSGRTISSKLFDTLDKTAALSIYAFLCNNRQTFHLSQEILDILREIVVQKYEKIQIYRLNPSIHDMMNDKLYKLCINEQTFLVPLWHPESYFEDASGCEIMVICEPKMPSWYVTMDEDGNIYVDAQISLYYDLSQMIREDSSLTVAICDGKEFHIPVRELRMKMEQYYRIKNVGIAKIKNDIYDVSERSDVIVKIITT